eukprot:Skav201066  [mRNA]  locus=scaffold2848:216486:221133:- [translate_table: standard]
MIPSSMGHDPPVRWKDYLIDSESIGSTKADISVYVRERRTMLIQPVERINARGLWKVQLLSAQGTSAWAAVHSHLSWDREEVVGHLTIQWNRDLVQHHTVRQFWLQGALNNDDQALGYDYQVDADTVIIPIGDEISDDQHVKVLELFAGYYGGWGRAITHLTNTTDLKATVVAVENDLRACTHYAVSHGVPIISGYEHLDPDLLRNMHASCILHADATDTQWLPAAGQWRPNFLCISAPCPPWSKAAAGPGMHSPQGMILPESIMLGKWLKPQIILIENVVGTRQHEHYGFVFRTIQHAGYKILWSGVVELAMICPVKRPRWLAILTRVDCAHIDDKQMQFIRSFSSTNPILYKSVLFNDIIDYHILGISPEVKRILSSLRHAPGPKRARTSPEDIFASRCHNGWSTLPCFLASYGNQHNLVGEDSDNACLTHLACIGDSAPRYWHPLEILLMHQLLGNTLLPARTQEGWRGLGNQIATPHAVFLIHNALNMLTFIQWPHELKDILQAMHNNRIDTSNMHVQATPVGLWVSHGEAPAESLQTQHIEAIEHILHNHGHTFMPEARWWNLNGFQPMDQLLGNNAEWVPEHMSVISTQSIPASSEDIPATVPMPIYMTISMQRENDTPRLWALSELMPESIPFLWKDRFQVMQATEDDVNVVKLLPIEGLFDHAQIQRVTACWIEGQLTLYPTQRDQPVLGQLQRHMPDKGLYDAFGMMDHILKTHRCYFVCDFHIRHMRSQIAAPVILAAFHSAVVNFTYDPTKDSWNINIRGEQVPVATLTTFFAHCVHPDDLLRLGRTFTIQHVEGGVIIAFIPMDARVPIPPIALEVVIAMAATRRLFDTLPHDDPRTVELNWMGRPLWQGQLNNDVTDEVIKALLQVALGPFTAFAQQRLIIRGKSFYGSLREFSHAPTDAPLKIHLIEEMCGGTGPAPSGAKNNHRQQVRNSIASSLLEQGIELAWVHEHVDRMISTIGMAKIVPVASQAPGALRDARVSQLFADAGLPLPPLPRKGVVTPGALRVKHKKKAIEDPLPCNLRLNLDFLTNEDGSATKQIQDIRGQSTGVTVTDPQGALQWLRSGNTISGDELGMFVIGRVEQDTGLKAEKVTLPCFDHLNNQILVHGTLYQLGEKQLRVKPWDACQPKSASSKVCSITLWQTDWTPEQWKQALAKTNQFLREVLADIQQVKLTAAQVVNMQGLVKGRNSYGIRVTRTSFEENYKKLFPGETPPDDMPASYVFKLEPVPFGTNNQMLREWSSLVGWPMRPIRALGSTTWLVCAPKHPPADFLAWNGNPVLVTFLPPRQTNQSTAIVAGPRRVRDQPQKETSGNPSNLDIGDPWSPFFQNKGKPLQAATPAAPLAARAAQGPVEQKLQHQEERIRGLEDKMTNMLTMQDKQAQQIQTLHENASASEKRIGEQVTQAIGAVKSELTEAFSAAIRQQTQNFDQNLRDIKNLLAQSKRKTSCPQEDEEMER